VICDNIVFSLVQKLIQESDIIFGSYIQLLKYNSI